MDKPIVNPPNEASRHTADGHDLCDLGGAVRRSARWKPVQHRWADRCAQRYPRSLCHTVGAKCDVVCPTSLGKATLRSLPPLFLYRLSGGGVRAAPGWSHEEALNRCSLCRIFSTERFHSFVALDSSFPTKSIPLFLPCFSLSRSCASRFTHGRTNYNGFGVLPSIPLDWRVRSFVTRAQASPLHPFAFRERESERDRDTSGRVFRKQKTDFEIQKAARVESLELTPPTLPQQIFVRSILSCSGVRAAHVWSREILLIRCPAVDSATQEGTLRL